MQLSRQKAGEKKSWTGPLPKMLFILSAHEWDGNRECKGDGRHLQLVPRILEAMGEKPRKAGKSAFRFAGVACANDGKHKAENEVASQREPSSPFSQDMQTLCDSRRTVGGENSAGKSGERIYSQTQAKKKVETRTFLWSSKFLGFDDEIWLPNRLQAISTCGSTSLWSFGPLWICCSGIFWPAIFISPFLGFGFYIYFFSFWPVNETEICFVGPLHMASKQLGRPGNSRGKLANSGGCWNSRSHMLPKFFGKSLSWCKENAESCSQNCYVKRLSEIISDEGTSNENSPKSNMLKCVVVFKDGVTFLESIYYMV